MSRKRTENSRYRWASVWIAVSVLHFASLRITGVIDSCALVGPMLSIVIAMIYIVAQGVVNELKQPTKEP